MKFDTFLAFVVAFIAGGVAGLFSYAGDQSMQHAAMLGGLVGGIAGLAARLTLWRMRS